MSSCFVCTKEFTEDTGFTCACSFESCLACIKKYLLDKSHQEPHCMNCRNVWDAGFMTKHFKKYFLLGEYRKKKEDALFERDKTHLPELQAEADRLLQLERLQRKINKYTQQKSDNHNNEDQTVRDQRTIDRILSNKIYAVSTERVKLFRERSGPVKRPVTMKCTMEKNGEVCRGFLSEKYECGLCHTKICRDCHKPVETGKEVGKHECDKDDVSTVTELKKTTRPCPSCHIPIFKTDGCDQMFCIQCHTAFSWETGKVDTGVIHNPHYFQTLREGNIRDPRHQNHQGECGPMPQYHAVLDKLTTIYGRRAGDIPHSIHETIDHYYQVFQHHRIVTLRGLVNRDEGLENIRLSYLTGKYTEKQYKQKLFVLDQTNTRKREEQQIMDTYVTIGEEYFRDLVSHYNNRTQLHDMLRAIRTLVDVTFHSLQILPEKYSHAGHHGLIQFFGVHDAQPPTHL